MNAIIEKAERAIEYAKLRQEFPEVPVTKIWGYVRSDHDQNIREFLCPGHEWACSGTAYGGEDPRWCGEGRMYCLLCGADGDG